MNTNSKVFLNAARLCFRQMSKSSEVIEIPSPRFHRLKETQKRFQIDDGTPVYLKGGVGDKILFVGTTVLTFITLGMSGETFYRLMKK